ncbi:MAG: glutathione S-transferase family protein [Actinobacteria bacterium]|nr:glutathione S-transferase family protein [Actinomycetota bacterium]
MTADPHDGTALRMPLRVFHRTGAGRPIRVAWTLEEAGLPYEVTILTKEDAADAVHRARHPLGRVPVLEDPVGPLHESTYLCLHVADLAGDDVLIPPVATHDRAIVTQWAMFAMTELEAPLIEAYRHRSAAPEIADAASRRANAAAEAVAAPVGRRRRLRASEVHGRRCRGQRSTAGRRAPRRD